MFEIGCDFFMKNPKGDAYKEMDKWWLIDMADIIKPLEDPEVVKKVIGASTFSKPAKFEFCCVLCFGKGLLSTLSRNES